MNKTQKFIERARKIHGDNYNYSLVEYKNAKTKITITCNKCNYVWMSFPHNHLSGSGCKECQYKNLPQNQPHSNEWFLVKANCIHGNKFTYLSEFKSTKKKIKIRCNTCDSEFYQRAGSHLEGNGCRKCAIKSNARNHATEVTTFENGCRKIHSERYEYFGDYTGARNKIKILCKKHNEIFYQNASAHYHKRQGCPKCRLSRREKKIEDFLNKHNIKFQVQKTFENLCEFKTSPYRFDFYLQDYNACIEYNGELHYISVEHFGGDEMLVKYKERDLLKKNFCIENNIKLIIIPYTEFDYINEILEKELLSGS